MTASAWRTAVLLAALLMWPLPDSRASTESLRGVEGLARAYDAILDARFDDVRAELSRACGPAPAEACDVIAATALWWQILLDPENRDLDDEFTGAVEHAIRTTEAWTERAPNDADAWFYLGGAYAARVQWRVLRDEKLVGRHAALTPVWSETAWFADYVLPVGLGSERHDLASFETHAGSWLGFRQPVQRALAEREARPVETTRETNPGEVWEENEFWIELSWRIDPDGALGIRRHH